MPRQEITSWGACIDQQIMLYSPQPMMRANNSRALIHPNQTNAWVSKYRSQTQRQGTVHTNGMRDKSYCQRVPGSSAFEGRELVSAVNKYCFVQTVGMRAYTYVFRWIPDHISANEYMVRVFSSSDVFFLHGGCHWRLTRTQGIPLRLEDVVTIRNDNRLEASRREAECWVRVSMIFSGNLAVQHFTTPLLLSSHEVNFRLLQGVCRH